jgi:uncharacterized protein
MAPATAIRWFRQRRAEPARDLIAFDPRDFTPPLKTQLLILQPTPFCNIDCDYCYLPQRDSSARMNVETARRAAARLVQDGLASDEITVAWHAGEPLTVPIAFYDSAMDAIDEALAPCRVSHSIQTNATLVNDAWCEFIARRGVRMGVSVDGPARVHDAHRRTRDGKGTHERVVRGMAALRAHGIPFHAIAVVTAEALDEPDAFVDFFIEQGVAEVGCNFDEVEGGHARSSLDTRETDHATFLARLLERSVADGGRFRVRELANAFQLIAHGLATYDWRGERLPLNAQVVPFALVNVAWNGDFSSFSPELLGQRSHDFMDFRLGNVAHESYFESTKSDAFRRLWGAVRTGVRRCGESCAHFDFCGGGAPANKLYENGDMASAETLYCRSMLKRPFDLVLAQLERPAKTVA